MSSHALEILNIVTPDLGCNTCVIRLQCMAGRYWEMVERLKLNHIYLAPTSLRLLLKSGDSWVTKYDLSSLRKLGCGEHK